MPRHYRHYLEANNPIHLCQVVRVDLARKIANGFPKLDAESKWPPIEDRGIRPCAFHQAKYGLF